MIMITLDEMRNRLGYHPGTLVTQGRHRIMREVALTFASHILAQVPEGREQALALTALQESLMWANAGIACNLAPLEQ